MNNSKKHILCLIDGLGLGGAQRQMIGLVNLLRQAGYTVDLAVYHDRDFYHQLLQELQIEVIKLVHNGSKWSKLTAVRRLIRQNGYGVLITYMTGPNLIGSLLKWCGMSLKLIISDRTTLLKRTWKEDLIYAICRKADYIVPNSYSQAAYLTTNYPKLADKVRTITNFTDPRFVAYPPQPERQSLLLLGAGRISWEKNVLTLVRAIGLLKKKGIQIALRWYGDTCRMEGSESCKQAIEAEIMHQGLQDVVTLFPATYSLQEAYRACDAFCLPSFSEGFPNVVCEAMSSARPILCSNVCDNPHIVKDGDNGFLFDPQDVEVVAETLERFCSLPYEQRVQMGQRSRELAEQNFSTSRFVGQYIQLIEQ